MTIRGKQLEVVQNECTVQDTSVCICVGGGVGRVFAVAGHMQTPA